MDHYEALGVGKDATPEEIKKAYKRKAQKAHPDRKDGDTAEFQVLTLAYETLSDPERRDHYDRTGQSARPQTIEEEAETQLAQLFDAIIDRGDIDQRDIIQLAKECVDEDVGKVTTINRKIVKKLEAAEKLLDRVTSTNDNNLFRGALESRIASYRQSLDRNNRTLELLHEIAKLLGCYKDNKPPVKKEKEPVQVFGFGPTVEELRAASATFDFFGRR